MNTELQEEQWDLIIRPKSHLLDINLKETWRYRDLLLMFIKRDFAAQYKQTILGPLWHLIQPLFTTIIYFLIFTKIAKISTGPLPPFVFYLANITVWNYFSTCLNLTSNVFTSNAWIFNKVYFPRLIIPLSVIVSNLVKFVIQFSLLVIVIFVFILLGVNINISAHVFLIILLIPVLAFLGLGMGIIISSFTIKYRDLSILLSFAVQLLMYATPVVYPLSAVSDPNLRIYLSINPLTHIFEVYRYILFNSGDFELVGLLYSISLMLVLLFVGIILFNKVEKTCMDVV